MDIQVGRIYKFRQRDTSDERHGKLVIVCGFYEKLYLGALVRVQFIDSNEIIVCTDKCLTERGTNENLDNKESINAS